MLADRIKALAPSPTLAIQVQAQSMRAQGIDVISFGAGEPDFDTPERIKEAALRSNPASIAQWAAVATGLGAIQRGLSRMGAAIRSLGE